MSKFLVLLVFICNFLGCVAIVDHQGPMSRVKTFIITDDEALYLLEKADEKDPEEKKEITFFKGR